MKAKYIIHTVGPIYSGAAEDAVQLVDCYRNSLELAKTYDIHSIAFPAIFLRACMATRWMPQPKLRWIQ